MTSTHHIGDEEDAKAEERGSDGVDSQLAAKDPQRHCQAQAARSDLLVARQRAQLLKLLPAVTSNPSPLRASLSINSFGILPVQLSAKLDMLMATVHLRNPHRRSALAAHRSSGPCSSLAAPLAGRYGWRAAVKRADRGRQAGW